MKGNEFRMGLSIKDVEWKYGKNLDFWYIFELLS